MMVRNEPLWSGTDALGVAICYAPGRSARHGTNPSEGVTGPAQTDGCSECDHLRVPDRPEGPLTLAECYSRQDRLGPQLGGNAKTVPRYAHNRRPIPEEQVKPP